MGFETRAEVFSAANSFSTLSELPTQVCVPKNQNFEYENSFYLSLRLQNIKDLSTLLRVHSPNIGPMEPKANPRWYLVRFLIFWSYWTNSTTFSSKPSVLETFWTLSKLKNNFRTTFLLISLVINTMVCWRRTVLKIRSNRAWGVGNTQKSVLLVLRVSVTFPEHLFYLETWCCSLNSSKMWGIWLNTIED